jgi:hypothetical protein
MNAIAPASAEIPGRCRPGCCTAAPGRFEGAGGDRPQPSTQRDGQSEGAQANEPVDRDQGDDNASARAIQVVCGKDTPAPGRSAICPAPVSPG